jgi:two-component system chemotaxis response regulator CheB
VNDVKPPLKVLVVDDSRIFRGLLEEIFLNFPYVEVIGSVWNGKKALEAIQQEVPHLVILDVEMPEMNGIETLKQIQIMNESRPRSGKIGVLMLSSLTLTGAKVTLESLQLGAFDFLAKPSGLTQQENSQWLARELAAKIKPYYDVRFLLPDPPFVEPLATNAGLAKSLEKKIRKTEVRAVLIGASTGGPKALLSILPELTHRIKIPIIVVLHMPPLFTGPLAESFDKKCDSRVVECKGNEVLQNETVYIAPGGKHLVLRNFDEDSIVTVVNENPPEDACCPSLNVLFRSAARVIPNRVIAVIMTGMGSDGTKGLGPLKRAGAYVIAQDEASSVIWGMPGNAVKSGNVDKVVPLEKIPEAVQMEIMKRHRD